MEDKQMKKTVSLIMAAFMAASLMASCSEAEKKDTVRVTVASGELLLICDEVALSDADEDGKLTVNDALYLAHEENFEGGAAAGYASEMTEYGLSLVNLWNIGEYAPYGYTVNNVSAMSLADEIKAGDSIVAYAYTDTVAWSDTYCFFDKLTADVGAGEEFTLTLSTSGWDESFNSVTLPLEGAVITVNGEVTDCVTDAEGKVTLSVSDDAVISAVKEGAVLVPPVFVARIK